MFYINGILWRVKFVNPMHPMLFREDGSLAIGMCDNSERTIYINCTLYGYLLKKAISHEITHASMFSYGIYLSEREEELLADLVATYGEEIIIIADKIFSKLRGRY